MADLAYKDILSTEVAYDRVELKYSSEGQLDFGPGNKGNDSGTLFRFDS